MAPHARVLLCSSPSCLQVNVEGRRGEKKEEGLLAVAKGLSLLLQSNSRKGVYIYK
jgi:hypothetical protein